jgi:hypothetical protein
MKHKRGEKIGKRKAAISPISLKFDIETSEGSLCPSNTLTLDYVQRPSGIQFQNKITPTEVGFNPSKLKVYIRHSRVCT